MLLLIDTKCVLSEGDQSVFITTAPAGLDTSALRILFLKVLTSAFASLIASADNSSRSVILVSRAVILSRRSSISANKSAVCDAVILF